VNSTTPPNDANQKNQTAATSNSTATSMTPPNDANQKNQTAATSNSTATSMTPPNDANQKNQTAATSNSTATSMTPPSDTKTEVNSLSQPMIQLPNGSTLSARYDLTRQLVIFEVLVKANSYLAIGFGKLMTNTNIAFWNADGQNSKMMDLYAIAGRVVNELETNNYRSKMTLLSDGSVHYISERALDTKQTNSFVIQLDTPIDMILAWVDTSPILIKHGPSRRWNWSMTLKSDGTSTSTNGLLPLSKGPLFKA
jgi:hypothetical protein